jgi:HEAT repeat protein
MPGLSTRAAALLLCLSAPSWAGTFHKKRTGDADVIGYLQHADPEWRRDAVEVVIDRDLRAAEADLTRLAHGDPDPGVRRLALRALRKLGSKEALPAAEAAVLEDRDKGNRVEAIALMEDLGNDRSAPVLAQVLEGDPEAGVRRKAVKVLAKRRWGGAEEAVLHAIRADSDAGVRKEALEAAARLLGEPGRVAAREVLGQDRDIGMRRLAADLLRDRPLAADRDVLLKAIDDIDEDVAIKATRGLRRLGDRSVGPILREKSRAVPNRKLAEELAEAATELGG